MSPRLIHDLILDVVLLIWFAAMAVFEYYWMGIGAFAFVCFAGAGYYAVLFCRTWKRRRDPPSRLEKKGKYRTLLRVLIPLLVGPLVVAVVSLDDVTVAGRPLFAGPVIRGVDIARSVVYEDEVAKPGHYFLIADVTVGSRLGAPLRYLSNFGFGLELTGKRLRPTSGLSQGCSDLQVPRWGTDSCRLVFQVPDSAESTRLHVEEFQRSHSNVIDLSSVPPAAVPRVELSVNMALPQVVRYRPEEKRVRMFVRAQPVSGAAPVSLKRLWLESLDGSWKAYDLGDDGHRECDAAVVMDSGYCIAVFYVPVEAQEARLILSTFSKPLPGAQRSAGVAYVDL